MAARNPPRSFIPANRRRRRHLSAVCVNVTWRGPARRPRLGREGTEEGALGRGAGV